MWERLKARLSKECRRGARCTLIKEQFHPLSFGRCQLDHFVVKVCRRVRERLSDVLILQFRIFALQLLTIGISSDGFYYPSHGQSKLANGWPFIRLWLLVMRLKVMAVSCVLSLAKSTDQSATPPLSPKAAKDRLKTAG